MGQSQGTTRFEDWDFLQKVKLAQSSTVWRAVHRESGENAAVKQIGRGRRQHAEREISMMKAAEHPNILRLLSVFEDQASIYLALEYFDGCNLAEKVKECGLGLREDRVAQWTQQMLSAVAYLHCATICHRDVKPDSFMVHKEGLKLSDFGLALFLRRGELLNEKCGTPAFMAPEQHLRKGYGHPCDVWAAGVTMFLVMLGGQHPFFTGGGQLDEKRLLEGTLDFSYPVHLFGFAALSKERFSEPARQLCRSMVEPAMTKRVTAEVALHDPWFGQQGVRKVDVQERCASESRAALGEPSVRRDGVFAQLASSPAAHANANSTVSTPAPSRSAASRKGSKESTGWFARSGVENTSPNLQQPATERTVTGRKGSKESTGWWSRAGVENCSPNTQAPLTERSAASRKGSKESVAWWQLGGVENCSPNTQPPLTERSAASRKGSKESVAWWQLGGLESSSPSAEQPVARKTERRVTISETDLMGPPSRRPDRRVTVAEPDLRRASGRNTGRKVTISESELKAAGSGKETAGWWQFGGVESSSPSAALPPQQPAQPFQPLHRADRQSSLESELATSLMAPSSRKSSASWWPLSSAENADPNPQPQQAAANQWPSVFAKRHLSFEAALEF